MSLNITTANIIKAVESHPTRWQLVTRESALSLPVPVEQEGQKYLAFFWYPEGGPVQNRIVRAPTYRVLASVQNSEDIVFLPIQPGEVGEQMMPGTPLGKPTIGGSTPHTEMKAIREQLYLATDAVLACYLKPAAMLSAEDRQMLAGYNALFMRLAVVVLLPAYHALNPSFFQWLKAQVN